MPQDKQPNPQIGRPPTGEPSRSFKGGGARKRVGSRRYLEAGEEDNYATDTFSRNDREGLPSETEVAEDDARGETSSVEATPDGGPLRASDDPDSRDAVPPSPRGGGVR
jgi:hypothetical protein